MENINGRSSFFPPPYRTQCERCHLQYQPRSWHQKYCQSCQKVKAKEWTENAIAKRPEYYQRKARENAWRYRLTVKVKVLGHYSNQTFTCGCCGESERDFLTINHLDGEGNRQSKELGIPRSSHRLCEWLIRNEFPAGYQVLCMKCNVAKGLYGACPHKRTGNSKGLASIRD